VSQFGEPENSAREKFGENTKFGDAETKFGDGKKQFGEATNKFGEHTRKYDKTQ
jgi:hypothetical protein